jgi:hypothetical protein
MTSPPLEEYYRKCLEIRKGFGGREWPKPYLDWQVVDALFAFTGEEAIAEEDFPQIQERYKRGRDLLRAVFRHEDAKDEFLDFLKPHPETTHTFQNQMSPLFVAAFNIITGRPLSDRTAVEENRALFRENRTILDHPWYGEHELAKQPLLDKYVIKIPWKKRETIRILIVGGGEKPRGPSASVYFKQILARIPGEGKKIHITVNDTFFQKNVYSFNRAGFFRGKKVFTRRRLRHRYFKPRGGPVCRRPAQAQAVSEKPPQVPCRRRRASGRQRGPDARRGYASPRHALHRVSDRHPVLEPHERHNAV